MNDRYYHIYSVAVSGNMVKDAEMWCNENIGDETYIDHEYGKIAPNPNYPWGRRRFPTHNDQGRCRFIFHSEKDYVWFKMTWGYNDSD